ncbi:MAG: uroporphyrinogen decarboxylase family protein [Promethearchaeota archaeon]
MPEFNSLELIDDALNCKKPRRIPISCIGIDYEFMQRLFHSSLAFSKEEFDRSVELGIPWYPFHIAGAAKLGFNLCWHVVTSTKIIWLDDVNEPGILTLGRFRVATRESAYKPARGSGSRHVPHFWHHGPCFSPSTPKETIRKVIATQPRISTSPFKRYRRIMENCEKHYNLVVAGGTNVMWEPLSLGFGMGLVIKLWRRDRDFLHEIRDFLHELFVRNTEYLVKYGKPSVVMAGDDYGYNRGLQMNIGMWRELVKPTLSELVRVVHYAGIKFILHSCGKIEPLFKDFVEIGIDGVQSLKPTNDLLALKQKYGKDIALLGTLDDTDILKNASPSEITSYVKRCIDELGPAGYIPGPTNTLLDHPVENIVAMCEAIRNYKP